MSHRRSAVLRHQEPVGPHRELRCPPGTYFSSRSLRSNPSDLEENAVLDHKVRPRHRTQPPPQTPPHQPRTHTPRTGRATGPPAEDAPLGSRTTSLGSVLSPCGASSRFSQPGPPPAHPRVRQGHHPAHVRSSTYAPGEVPAPTQQAASLPIPRSPRASSPATSRIPASLEERRVDIGQHPQAHRGPTEDPLGNPYGTLGPRVQHVGCASPRLSPGV